MIYLDHNATTPIDPEVKTAVTEALEVFGNPSSTHRAGREARDLVERSRESVAGLIGAAAEEIVFTSGGTESNNLALAGYAGAVGGGHIISSSIEHPSVLNVLEHLGKRGFEITLVGTDRGGAVDPEEVRKALRGDTILVSIMHSNNETGVIQPVEEISAIVRERGIPLHTDAAQSVGKIPLTVEGLGCDMMTIVSHKFYGPKGIGALYVRKGIRLRPLMFGAGHEKGLRPGTENIPGIAGLGKASDKAGREVSRHAEHTGKVTNLLYRKLRDLLPRTRWNGETSPRLPNTLNVSIGGVSGAELVEALKEDVAISAGSACHSGVCRPSEVLLAMGLDPSDALSAVRISTGKGTSEEDVLKAAELIAAAAAGRV